MQRVKDDIDKLNSIIIKLKAENQMLRENFDFAMTLLGGSKQKPQMWITK